MSDILSSKWNSFRATPNYGNYFSLERRDIVLELQEKSKNSCSLA